jgi:hypothetical protein
MAHLHHPHLFSHEWFELHPAFAAGVKKYGSALCMGVLIAGAAVLVTRLEQNIQVPLRIAQAVEVVPGGAWAVNAPDYFPAQFVAQAQQASVEELPPQF